MSDSLRPTPPAAGHFVHLKPRDSAAAIILFVLAAVTAGGLTLSSLRHPAPWLLGQIILAFACVQWFVILHECGHGTFFRRAALNGLAGHIASLFSLIPYEPWKAVHYKHHKWTGWQDVDPTTAGLVPRPLGRLERALINVSWKCWIPLFSVLYRVTIFWNVPRLMRLFSDSGMRRNLISSTILLVAAYGGLALVVGPSTLLREIGLAFFLFFVLIDPLMLSQHTHIPQGLSQDQPVAAYPALAQEVFTRSLRFPRWFSERVLLKFDSHELHHMYPYVPGYELGKIGYTPVNEADWWQWIRAAKRLPAEVFMFQNRDTSGQTV